MLDSRPMSTLSNDHRAADGPVHRAAPPLDGRLRSALAGLRAAIATRRPVPSAVAPLAAELAQGLAAAVPARAVAVARLHCGVRPPPAARLLAITEGADLKATELFLADIEGGLAAPAGPSGLPTAAARDGTLVIAAAAERDEDGAAVVVIDPQAPAAHDPALGEGLRAIAIAVDDHLRACDAIAASDRRQLLEEALDGLGDGVIVYDSTLRIAAHNRRYTDYFPYFRALGSLRGRRLRDLAAYNVRIGRCSAG
jgi:PAS domain-containing protein